MPELFQANPEELLSLGLRLLIILILSAVIGFERERKNRPAGLRTHMVVAVASMLIMYIGEELAEAYNSADPARLAAQVVSGIGFLGAGTIIRGRKHDEVQGLTTAATLWAVAGIGIAVGAGYVWEAALTTLALFVILRFAAVFERTFSRSHSFVYDAELSGSLERLVLLQEILESNGFQLADYIVRGERQIGDERAFDLRFRIQTEKSLQPGPGVESPEKLLGSLSMLENVRPAEPS